MDTIGKVDDGLLERFREGKVVMLPTIGVSMRPFIQGGRDKVLVRRKEEVNVGDIVLVPYCGMMILHRVYVIEGSRLILMGDGNLKGNEVVDKSEVWGTVIQIVKPNGRCRKPGKAWLWRHTIPLRRYLLKLDKKWNQLFCKQ